MRKTSIGAIIGAAALALASSASAATFDAFSGFGTGSGFSACEGVSKTAAFATGQAISAVDYTGGCVGYFSVDVDTTLKTITLTGLEVGNYEEGYLLISGITGPAITGLSTLTFASLFNPVAYGGNFATAVPTPQLSFTGTSIKVLFSAYGGAYPNDQFAYDGNGGQAVFQYTAGVPEPATWGIMILGFGAAGSMIRRRRTLAA